MRWLPILFFAFLISHTQLLAQAPDSYTYKIVYTGRLLGYARVPDEDVLNGSLSTANSPVANAYLDVLDSLSKDGASADELRLSMGDNLAPDFAARTFRLNSTPPGTFCGKPWALPVSVRVPKDLFFHVDTGAYKGWWLHCQDPTKGQEKPLSTQDFTDNAAAFFVRAHYDAMVPGKHDFFLAAEYLRKVGAYLQSNHVRMLASNLVVVTSRAPNQLNVASRIPERLENGCHTDTGQHPCYHTDFRGASVDLSADVLPFKQQFVVKAARVPQNPATHTAYRPDEYKRLKVSEVQYNYVIDPNRTSIVIEGDTRTRMDPSMVLKPPSERIALRNAEDVCQGNIPLSVASTCKAIFKNGIYNPNEAHPSTDVTFIWDPNKTTSDGRSVTLAPGKNHMVCTYVRESPKNPSSPWEKDPTCKPFSVQVPFFWADEPNVAPVIPEREPQSSTFCTQVSRIPCPFALTARGSQTVAVFGVVAPDLLQNVGLINRSWFNIQHDRDTATKVISPEYALKQTLELCESIEVCARAPKVLLAEMSSARASQLIANFRDTFDVVISQAENEHPTRNRTVELSADRPQFILTPTVPFDQTPDYANPQASSRADGQQFQPVIYRATVSKTGLPDSDGAIYTSWTLKNEAVAKTSEDATAGRAGKPASINPVSVHEINQTCNQDANTTELCTGDSATAGQIDLQTAAARLLVKTNRAAKPSGAPAGSAASYTLKEVTLLAMRDQLKTDIAMLQERDFYNPDRLVHAQMRPGQLQNLLELILWKEDSIVKLHLKGSTLKKLLKQSDAFGELDRDFLSTEIERNRSLVYVGIYRDPKDSNSFLVNGAPLDDAKLYTVAASDFLAAGDTGYSDLGTPDVLPQTRVEDFEGQFLVAGVVCRVLAPIASPADPHNGDECLDEKLGIDYFDPAASRPFDATGGYDTMQHYRTFLRSLSGPEPLSKGPEASVQERAFWSLNLENLDFTYTGVYINHISKTTSSLGGVSVSGVAQAGSNSIGSDHKLRLVRDYNWGTFYVLSDSSLLRNSTSTSRVPSIVNNMLGSESGGTVRIPAHRSSWLSAQYSMRYERELIDPAPTAVKTPSLLLPNPQISTIYGRIGLRAEHNLTYLEFGGEEIDSRGVLQQYVFTLPGASPIYCQPEASGYLCGSNAAPSSTLNATPISSLPQLSSASIVPRSTDYLNTGAYFNANWKFPMWSRLDAGGTDQSWYFVLTNKGDFYFNSHTDTPVQTRYLDKLTPALLFPIWGKLSFSPKVDLILYENKVNGYHYRALQPGFSLSYSFAQREGMRWLSSLAYGAQTTSQPTTAGH